MRKLLDINVGKEEVVHNSSGSSIRSDCVSKIETIRTQNVNIVVIGNCYFNINSSPQTLMIWRFFLQVCMDNTFPVSRFHTVGFSIPCGLDRSINGDAVIVYAREDNLSKLLSKHNFKEGIECLPRKKLSFETGLNNFFFEINFRKSKWLLGGIYHPLSQTDQYFLTASIKS